MSVDSLINYSAETPTAGADQTTLQATNTADVGYGASRQSTTDGVMSWGWPTNVACVLTAANFVYGFPTGTRVVWVQFRRWQEFLKDLKRGLVPPSELRRRYREAYAI